MLWTSWEHKNGSHLFWGLKKDFTWKVYIRPEEHTGINQVNVYGEGGQWSGQKEYSLVCDQESLVLLDGKVEYGKRMMLGGEGCKVSEV